MSDLVLYRGVATRSFTALWMLEELGVAYRTELIDWRPAKPRPEAYLRLNPTGEVPTLTDGEAVVRETPAICLYLGDRYGYGTLAPRIEEPLRGAYLSWMVWSTAALDPARATAGVTLPQKPGGWGVGWRPLPEAMRILAEALAHGPYLLGETFTAADVMVGATLAMGRHTGEIPADPVLDAYVQRLEARPANQRAGALNWPPDLFAPA